MAAIHLIDYTKYLNSFLALPENHSLFDYTNLINFKRFEFQRKFPTIIMNQLKQDNLILFGR